MTAEDFYCTHPIKKIIINNTKWEYIACGQGKRAILIFPGGGQTAQMNFSIIKELENQFKIIALTIYSVDSINQFCKAVDKILENEKIDKVYLYGLSIGGLLAQSYLRRNKERVLRVILSHASAPTSPSYKTKIIRPLKMLKIILPFIPNRAIKLITKKLAGRVQGVSKNKSMPIPQLDTQTIKLFQVFTKDFHENYLDKRLLKTWVNLHLDFYNNEKFSPDDLRDWKGKVLILRTDNDPLMQDDGEFKRLYPSAQVHTFKGTGHLSFYYQFKDMMKIIKSFLFALS